MIRAGKRDGWLKLSPGALLSWATLNDVSFGRTVPGSLQGRGGALLAKDPVNADDNESPVLLTIPRDLILSLERVQEHAKVDRDFREVLESLDDFGRTPRGAILSFLLFQASMSCPNLSSRFGVHSPFSDYVKSLPMEPLPTFWAPQELQLLIGTTLAPAVSSKLKSLRREYDLLCSSAEQSLWYRTVLDRLDFDDWLQVDAMYRSRALDFPQIGHCMVPCIDLANHASGDETMAIYEKDAEGDAILMLRDGKHVKQGDEVTITYGDEKGACEMLFSYGFLEDSIDSARTLFLSLTIPDADNLRIGKARTADCAPGFKLFETASGEIDWTGDFIWLLCVNEDDDLHFELARTIDSRDEEMQAMFQGRELTGGAAELHNLLAKTNLWDVYQLRAVAILQQRILDQLQVLYQTQEDVDETIYGDGTEVGEVTYGVALKLRQLEFALLEGAYQAFETKKSELVDSPVVTRYLAIINEGEAVDTDPDPPDRLDRVPESEDFS